MFNARRAALAAIALSLLLVPPAGAAEQSTVKVFLIDMTAMFGPGGGPVAGSGNGMMGPGYGQGYGMMGPGDGQGMMGPGFGPGYAMMGRGMMGGMSVRTNVTSVKAGNVTFDVTNLSRSIVHEMIVVAVENPNAPLPYDYNAGQIPEKQVKMLGETEEMQPNAEKTITIDLKPGAYLVICNVPGHYAAGMWTPLTVTE
jgi:uncharacterized cupredoxin-like copper-binding protein